MARDTKKGTKKFQETISAYLYSRIEQEPQFALKLANPSKSMEGCCTYIINQVRKSGCCGFADEEIYNMALHYWDEAEVETGQPISCDVVVNHIVELTEEEKAQARKEAMERLCREQMEHLRHSSTPHKKQESKEQIQSPGLFDDL